MMAVKRSAKVVKDLKQEAPKEPAWTYRGYELMSSELAEAIKQLFCMAGQRAGSLRQRLDTTTKWAIVSTGATLSFVFADISVHHGVIIINSYLISDMV
jgi:uncharacterized membrane protein